MIDKIDILIVIPFVISIVLLFGIWLLYSAIQSEQDGIKKEQDGRTKKRHKAPSKIDKELERLIEVTVNSKITVKQFYIISASLFIVIGEIITINASLISGIIVGLISASIPYFLLRYRLIWCRNRGSLEAEDLIQAILLAYRGTNFNMQETLEEVVRKSDNIPTCKKQIFEMAVKAKSAKSKSEIKRATDLFAYTIGVNWAKMLSNNIYRALTDGSNVSESLEDILVQMKSARYLAEERKRLNSESGRLIYLIPASYIGSLFLCKTVDISVQEFIKNQFTTKQGILFFSVILILSSLSILFMSLAKGKKFDF